MKVSGIEGKIVHNIFSFKVKRLKGEPGMRDGDGARQTLFYYELQVDRYM